MLNIKSLFILVLICSILVVGCGSSEKSTEALDDDYLTENPQYLLFLGSYPNNEVFAYIVGDCNDDAVDDLTLVYKVDSDSSHLVTVYSNNDKFLLSKPISAPVDSCTLKWKDVDEKPPIELLVSGQKGVHFGYGVYRFAENEWVSLYGDMLDCC